MNYYINNTNLFKLNLSWRIKIKMWNAWRRKWKKRLNCLVPLAHHHTYCIVVIISHKRCKEFPLIKKYKNKNKPADKRASLQFVIFSFSNLTRRAHTLFGVVDARMKWGEDSDFHQLRHAPSHYSSSSSARCSVCNTKSVYSHKQ
jgi:hypothetical protein